jgi:hypothetical protein
MRRRAIVFCAVILGAAVPLGCAAHAYGQVRVIAPPPPPSLSIHAGVGVGADASAAAYTDPNPDVLDTTVFYEPLAPYGVWTTVEPYGRVWVPRVTIDWRPYSNGYWTYTDVGWTWVSAEPYGWAVFHYGRWYRDPVLRWVWVPGRHWAPAWVAWRHGGDEVGWAPLPPTAHWRVGLGLDVSPVEVEASLGPDEWHFVHERYVDDRDLHRYYEPRERNAVLVHDTTNVTNYTVVNRRIVNNSVDVREVERVRGTPVRRTRIVNRRDPGRSEVTANGDVAVYVPPRAGHAEHERGRMRPHGGPVPPAPRHEAPVAQRPNRERAEHAIEARQSEAGFVRVQPNSEQHAAAAPRGERQPRRTTAAPRDERGAGRAGAREARQHRHPAHARRDRAVRSPGVSSDRVARHEIRRERRHRER